MDGLYTSVVCPSRQSRSCCKLNHHPLLRNVGVAPEHAPLLPLGLTLVGPQRPRALMIIFLHRIAYSISLHEKCSRPSNHDVLPTLRHGNFLGFL